MVTKATRLSIGAGRGRKKWFVDGLPDDSSFRPKVLQSETQSRERFKSGDIDLLLKEFRSVAEQKASGGRLLQGK